MEKTTLYMEKATKRMLELRARKNRRSFSQEILNIILKQITRENA